MGEKARVPTQITKVDVDWTEIKNDCRNTMGKEPTGKEATEGFKKKLLIAEHSPIREGWIKWRWDGIKSWISVHWVRHHEGVEKFVSTQRSDRTGIDRNKKPQDAPVSLVMNANLQALINMARVRLCYQAAPETRGYMEDLKEEITKVEPEVGAVMVPNCVYRGGCPEFKSCGLWDRFILDSVRNSVNIGTIQDRYDAYNKWFYNTNKVNKQEES